MSLRLSYLVRFRSVFTCLVRRFMLAGALLRPLTAASVLPFASILAVFTCCDHNGTHCDRVRPQIRVLVKRLLNGNCGQRGAVLLSLQGSAVRCFSAWILKGFSSAARCFSACSLPTVVIIVGLIVIACEATRRRECAVKHVSEALRIEPQPDA